MAAMARSMISTFSCDIAYSASPAASRASCRLRKARARAILPSHMCSTAKVVHSTGAPLPCPEPCEASRRRRHQFRL